MERTRKFNFLMACSRSFMGGKLNTIILKTNFLRTEKMNKNIIAAILAGAAVALATGCPAPANMNSTANANRTSNGNMTMSNSMSNTNSMSNSNMMSNANTMSNSSNPMVGGAAMLATKDIVDNASNSKDHTTLVAAVKAAGLVETLKGAGPFTVFAPTNAAFDKLPKGTVDTLLKPESKDALSKVLTYHVVAGKMDAAAIAKAIEAGKGKAALKTVQGGNLTASMEGNDVIVTDEKGGKAKVTIADVMQSNGVIHVVDTVLMHK
jgi:uncharacterized surface protein with fasciclin (FAS1) repeats